MDLVRHRRYGFGLFIVVFLFSGNGFAEDAPGATARLTFRGQDFPLVWNWDAGLSLTFPIFSGNLTQSQVAEARLQKAMGRGDP